MPKLGEPELPMAVRVPLVSTAHIVYAFGGKQVEQISLCGIILTRDDVLAWPKARGMSLCEACDAEDLKRYPNRIARMLR